MHIGTGCLANFLSVRIADGPCAAALHAVENPPSWFADDTVVHAILMGQRAILGVMIQHGDMMIELSSASRVLYSLGAKNR